MAAVSNQAQFEALFGPRPQWNRQTDGHWRSDSGGSTGSANTGPGTNNALAFVHTETSGSSDLATIQTNGIAQFVSLPDAPGRLLKMRLCIQGNFGDGTEGLEVQHRAGAGDAWKQAGMIHGWGYSNARTTGDTFDDEAGVSQTVAADGGWVDFEVPIPDSATQVRLHPRYVLGSNDKFTHDIALADVEWGKVDLKPSFGAAAVAEQVFTRGTPIAAVNLPAASGGDGALTYSLTPALPAGLRFAPGSRRITGTPTATVARRQYTLTARDTDGDTAELRFGITVHDPAPPPGPRPDHPGYLQRFRNTLQRFGGELVRFGSTDTHDFVGTKGVSVLIDGIERGGQMPRPSLRITQSIDTNSTCRFMLRGASSHNPNPAFGQTVVVRDIETGQLLFSGIVLRIKPKLSGKGFTYREIRVSCVGHEFLLAERITRAEAVILAGLDSASAQLRSLLTLGTVDLATDTASAEDFGWQRKRKLVTALQQLTGAVVWAEPTPDGVRYNVVDPDRLERMRNFEFNPATVVEPEHALDTQHAVRRQHLLAGNFTRVRTFFGDNVTTEWALNDTFDELDYFEDGLSAYGLGDVFQDRGLRFYEDREVLVTAGSVEIIPSGSPATTTWYVGQVAFGADQWVMFLDRAALEVVILSALLLPPPANNLDLLLQHIESGDRWHFLDAEVQSGGVPTREEAADVSPIPPLFDGSPNTAYALFGYNDLIYFGQGLRNNAGFLAYNPETGEAQPDDDIEGIPATWKADGGGMTESAGSLFGVRRDSLGAGASAFRINELRLSDLTKIGGDGAITASGRPGFPAGNRRQINGVDMCSDATTLYVLGWYQDVPNSPTPQIWGLWAFSKTQSTVQGSLLQDEDAAKHILLPGTGATRWTGCALSGSTIGVVSGAANDDSVIFYNRFTKAREPLLDIELPEHANTLRAVAVGEHFHIMQRSGGGFTGSRTLAYTTKDRKLRWTATAAQRDEILKRAGEDASFRVVMVDGSIAGVEADRYRFVEGYPVEVRGAPNEFAVTTGGILALASLGGEGSQWAWSRAKQAIVHSGTPLTDVDRVRVAYRIGWILTQGGGSGLKDGLEDQPDIFGRTEAAEALAAVFERGRDFANRLTLKIHRDIRRHFRTGTRIPMDLDLAAALGVPNPASDDVWIVEEVEFSLAGFIPRYTVHVERGKFTSQVAEYQRRRGGDG